MKSTPIRLKRAMLLILALCLPTLVASAQQTTKTAEQVSAAIESEKRSGSNFDSSFASDEFAFNGTVVVQGAPFSAVGIKETTQILSDGRSLVRRRTTSIYRDSEGRTRSEWGNATKAEGVARVPIIYDAVTGEIYFLNHPNRRATRFPSSITDATPRLARIITPQSPPEKIANVLGEVIEPLGTKMIEGVEAEGVRVTTTIRGTETSGQLPAKVIYERWYSQALRRNVLIKCTDPRFGEAVYRLTKIDRTEPKRELFVIPAEYKIGSFGADKPARSIKSGYVN
jgi:hypothetical protein